MKISYKKLELYSMIFIYFPIIIFLLGWLRLSIAILGIIFLAYTFYKLYYKNNLDITGNIFIEKNLIFDFVNYYNMVNCFRDRRILYTIW